VCLKDVWIEIEDGWLAQWLLSSCLKLGVLLRDLHTIFVRLLASRRAHMYIYERDLSLCPTTVCTYAFL
jgi:hypothetical protein